MNTSHVTFHASENFLVQVTSAEERDSLALQPFVRLIFTDEPETFGFDADELADVLPGARPLSLERLVVLARRCPGLAIDVFDDNGRQVAP